MDGLSTMNPEVTNRMFNKSNYSGRVKEIIDLCENGYRLVPLVPCEPVIGKGLKLLTRLSTKELFSPSEIAAFEDARCIQSLLYLYFSDLNSSHQISQSIPSVTGSFLHGIMHRQEPDFPNSKYWFRKVKQHAVFPQLRKIAPQILNGDRDTTGAKLCDEICGFEDWEPFWFIDKCQMAYQASMGDLEQKLMEIQRLEWQLLFDYCYRRAVGTN